MDKLIGAFPQQLKEAIEIGRAAEVKPYESEIHNIVVSGLGGSGIGGDLVKSLVRQEIKVPFMVNKGYNLPAFCNKNTLVIISSYSGNTEETLHAMQQAIKQQCMVACISSNGKVAELAEEYGMPIIHIPGGMPPRACLGYSFVQQVFILEKLGVLKKALTEEIWDAMEFLEENQSDIMSIAEALSGTLNGKIPVIYCEDVLEPIALRFRQQINENAKMLCWHNVLPEMNHNEIVGWRKRNDDIAAIFLNHSSEYYRNAKRREFSETVISKYTSTTMDITPEGDTPLKEMMYFIHLFDWISFYLSELNGHDPVEVEIIDKLKKELSDLK